MASSSSSDSAAAAAAVVATPVASTASNKRRPAAAAPALPSPSEPLDEQERAAGLICVRLGKKHQNRIFHEFDERHPHDAGQGIGEALVVGGRVVKVAPTTRVRAAIMQGILEEVRDGIAHPQLPDLIDRMNEIVLPGIAPMTPAKK